MDLNRSNHRLQVRTIAVHLCALDFLDARLILKVSQMSWNTPGVSSGVPVVPLNFSALSAEGPFHRDAVERCVRETLLLLLRAAATRPSVSHAFPGIGLLTFQQSRVQMQFSRDFISALDGSGKLSSASASVSHSEPDFSVFPPDAICLIKTLLICRDWNLGALENLRDPEHLQEKLSRTLMKMMMMVCHKFE